MTLHLKAKTKLYQVWVMDCMGQGESPEAGPLSTEPLLSKEGKEPVGNPRFQLYQCHVAFRCSLYLSGPEFPHQRLSQDRRQMEALGPISSSSSRLLDLSNNL
jgi:hypothetical protein